MQYRTLGRTGLRVSEIGLSSSYDVAHTTELAENMAVSDLPDLNPLELERVARLHGNITTVLA